MDEVAVPIKRSVLIKSALAETRKLPRPAGISSTRWTGIQAVLFFLAGKVPHIFPTQYQIAEYTGFSRKTIIRYLCIAEEHGLIERVLVPSDSGRWDHYHIRLLYLKKHPQPPLPTITAVGQSTITAVGQFVPETFPPTGGMCIPSESTPSAGANQRSELLKTTPPGGGAAMTIGSWPEETKPDPMMKRRPRDYDSDSGTALGADPDEHYRKAGKTLSGLALNGRTLAVEFQRLWREVCVAYPEYADYRAVEKGAFSRYMRLTFLGREASDPRTPEQVYEMIEAFMADVGTSVMPTEEYPLWRIFAGRWHKYQQGATVPSPSALAASIAEDLSKLDEYLEDS